MYYFQKFANHVNILIGFYAVLRVNMNKMYVFIGKLSIARCWFAIVGTGTP